MADDRAGDAACWLDQVCDICGGFIEDGRDHECRQPVPGGAAAPAEPGDARDD